VELPVTALQHLRHMPETIVRFDALHAVHTFPEPGRHGGRRHRRGPEVGVMSVLVRGARVITAVDDYAADVYAENETITLIGRDLDVRADTVLDGTGCYLLPGGVDPHVHLDFPSGDVTTSDSVRTGTEAAAHGGTTTVINFAPDIPGVSLPGALDAALAKADGQAAIDYGNHLIITRLDDQTLPDLRTLTDSGVTSVKLYMAYPETAMVDDATMFQVLERAGELGALTCVHAENGGVIDVLTKRALRAGHTGPAWHGSTRPELAEAEATHRAIVLAEMADAPVYFVHLSCEPSLAEVVAARDRGRPVFAETCPHYLLLDNAKYDHDGGFDVAKYVLTPPLRSAANHPHLWRGLRTDDISVLSTDHCPFCFQGQKTLGRDDFTRIPNGGPGIEHRLELIHDSGVLGGEISLQRMVEVFSTAPAKLFGLFPRKGTIAVGSDADLVLFDPAAQHTLSAATHHMNVDYSLYEGRRVTGRVRTVLSRGQVVIDAGRYVGRPGSGKFLHRGPSGRL
jgi:dihydropyrimidinase